MNTKSIKHLIIAGSLCCGAATALTSCSDLLDTDSELVEFQEDNRLQSPTDSVYSVMGIVYKMQAIADRTVLLGELRGGLTTTTGAASKDLKAIADFSIDEQNAYNRISDYYAIINNCNYYLDHINTELVKNGRKVFEGEYAVVKAYRAWTYLQLAQIYGSVPLIVEPVLTEEASRKAMQQSPMDINAICNYFIDDLKPYVDTKLPAYGQIDGMNSQKFFIPVRALLGDLCLWAGRYAEAAQYYHDFLALRTNPVPTTRSATTWSQDAIKTREFRYEPVHGIKYDYTSGECLAFIPMESNEFYGTKSNLINIFNSTDLNFQYAQVTPTVGLRQLSAAQDYCATYTLVSGLPDTIYVTKEELARPELAGDLRFGTLYDYDVKVQERFSRVSKDIQKIKKFDARGVTIYRIGMIYLRFAEALNRAGYPQSAFAVLKYGLSSENINKYIDDDERQAAGTLLNFDSDLFTSENTIGIHSRGSGDAECDNHYVLPMPADSLASRQDTINYQVPLVEDLIVNEMALEGVFEGYRFYDLMRVALRRGNPAYLADPVSRRDGDVDGQLRSLLLDTNNWYLPKTTL